MANVFDVFSLVEMNYLEISSGTVYGNRITSKRPIMGIFKSRAGMVTSNNMEAHTSSSTVHVMPKDFPEIMAEDNQYAIDELVGNGIEYAGQFYRISGATGGKNFDNGELEHITLTLEKEDYADDD